MEIINFIPANSMEKMLASLPKKCSCQMCVASKKNVIQALGEKRFKELCKLLKIYI